MTATLCQRISLGFARAPRPTADDLRATYAISDAADDEAAVLRAAARMWRQAGDHLAAGNIERDAAAVTRMAHTRRAAERALRRECGCARCCE